jgi:predicted Mrr-cat superfamily restriction endonuclease
MKTFALETTITAIVRVKAPDEETARKVVPTVLGAPATDDVKIINDTNQALGREAEIDDVEFVPSQQISLCEVDGELVKRRGKNK